ncbi:hypothetical protein SUDANB145_07304 (plasmid) [Streptomyces sp. enrichment culture]|uniref:hypothetical protein n=1 Tax=Streptomyces sp. enrichment culture TaxID=1795815 RepID=UPI003F550BEE
MDDDTWIEQGQNISTPNELREYIAALRAEVHHMQTGLARAAAGALSGRAWNNTPGDERPNHDDLLRDHLDMTATPTGMAAKDAVYRQSLAALLVALDAVDRATLTVWLADINAKDPNRPA